MREKHVIDHGAIDAITGCRVRWMGWGWMCWDEREGT